MYKGVHMEERISGMMVYYYYVCKRKLWYFSHDLQMEQNDENVSLGKALDKTSYARDDKHIQIDGVINIDFIRNYGVLHEVKKSRKIEDAGIWQVKYYLYYLRKRGVEDMTGKIDYPLLKQSIAVELTDADCKQLERVLEDIKQIIHQPFPPLLEKNGVCKKCAYYDLCYI